MESYLTVLEEA